MTQLPGLSAVTRLLRARRPVQVASHCDETPAFSLRAYRESDVPTLSALIARDAGSLFRWLPIPEGCRTSDDIARDWVRRASEGDRTNGAWRRLAVGETGQILGGVNLIRIERGLDWQADVNWWVASTVRGRGVGTELVRRCLDHAFADLPRGLGLHRVHAGIQHDNPASARVADKAGFVPDEALDSRLLVGGQWQKHRGYVATAA
ncbi:MAG: GNAT family N-acetyltransferase [Phycisphaerales bacterium JB040]